MNDDPLIIDKPKTRTISKVLDYMDSNLQLSRENIALKREIEQLNEKIKNLEKHNLQLSKQCNSLNEKIMMSNIQIKDLTNTVHEQKKEIRTLKLSKSPSFASQSSLPQSEDTTPQMTRDESVVDGEITESDVDNLLSSMNFDEPDEPAAKPGRRKSRKKETEITIKYLKKDIDPTTLFNMIKDSENKEEVVKIAKDILIASYPKVTDMKKHIATIVNTIVIWLKNYGESDAKTENCVMFLRVFLNYVSPQTLKTVKETFENSKRISNLFNIIDSDDEEEEEEEDS